MNLNKKQILKFRTSGEIRTLFLSIIVGLLVAYLVFGISLTFALVLILIATIYVALTNASFIGNSLLITHESLPNIHSILDENAQKLRIKTPKLYIQQNPVLNAFTIGITNPSIVLTSGLFDVLDENELRFVIGHELGHVFFKHNLITTLIYPAGQQIPFINYFFDFWSRDTEYSADRIGYYCSKDLDHAITALSKIAVGQKTFKLLGKNFLLNQEDDTFSEKLGETLYNHPYTVNRITRLVAFQKNLG